MARFFQTAPTQFVEDFIYQPPWELIQKATAQKQAQYDNLMAQAKLFENLPIQHLQGEDDVYNVKELQKYYGEKANQITDAIKKDPISLGKYLPNIEALSKELQADFTTGNISKIQSSYNAYQQWQKDNEQLKKDDPSRYAAANNYYLGQYLKDGGNSINRQYKGDLVTKDVDWEKLNSSAEKIKANEWSQQSAGAGGGYIYKNKKTGEVVTEDRIKGVIYGQLLSDPSNVAALRQSELYGLGKYFNPDTGAIDFNASGFTGTNMYAGAMAYSKQTSEQDMGSDGTYIANMKHQEWAVDRQDKLNKDYQDRVDAANKTKDEKVSAIDKEIADGWINNDMVKVQFYENAKNNLLGREGTFKSNAGSMFKNFSDLQTKSASGNIDAQKQLSQGLNTFLRKSGIDFKDPKQKALAEDIVGKIKQNKLSIDDIGDYLDKRIPAQINRTVDLDTQKFLKNRSIIAANNEKKQNLN